MGSPGCAVGFGHALDCVLVRHDVHDWHPWNLPDAAFEVLVTGGDDEAAVLADAFDDAVVGVGAAVLALESFEAGVLRYFEGESVAHSELFEFADHAVSDVGDALAEEAVHAGLEDVEAVLDGEVDEVGVDEQAVGRAQGVVLSEEQT